MCFCSEVEISGAQSLQCKLLYSSSVLNSGIVDCEFLVMKGSMSIGIAL